MMKDMTREIVSGLIVMAGTGAVVIASEASLPFLATAGALSALGAGMYSAISAPRHKRIRPGNSDGNKGMKTLPKSVAGGF
jgi:hypothetical protein